MSKNLQDLLEELRSDIPIDLTKLQSETANNPVLYAKWIRYRIDLIRARDKLESDKKIKMSNAVRHYTGKGDDVSMEIFTPTELKHILPADTNVHEISKKIDTALMMIDLCDGALDAIKQRGYAIRNIIDQRKFENGA
jgi:hypothetical protein